MREPADVKRCAVAFRQRRRCRFATRLRQFPAWPCTGRRSAQYVLVLLAEQDIYEGAMDELVDQVVGNVGIARPVAERAVGIIFDFLATEGPADPVKAMLERMPGAAEAAAAHAEGGGLLGAMGGIMGDGSRLMSAGLGMSEIQGIARVLIAHARDKAGDQDVNAIVDSIPGRSQFL